MCRHVQHINPILPDVFEINYFTKIRNFNQSEASKSSIDQSETRCFFCVPIGTISGKIGLRVLPPEINKELMVGIYLINVNIALLLKT